MTQDFFGRLLPGLVVHRFGVQGAPHTGRRVFFARWSDGVVGDRWLRAQNAAVGLAGASRVRVYPGVDGAPRVELWTLVDSSTREPAAGTR